MAGYIKIHRKLLEWEWYSVPSVKDVFIHLLITANFTASKYQGRTIERGQAIFGLDSLSDKLGYSVQQIRTALSKLKSSGEITVWTNRRYSVATITNYEKYQDIPMDSDCNRPITNNQQTDNTLITDCQQTDNRPITDNQHSNNSIIRKKEEKEIKNIYSSVIADFNQICQDLPKVRSVSKVRKGHIDRAEKLLAGITFAELFNRVQASDFLTGKVKDWRADFDWIMKPDNLTKIIEGNYDNRAPSPKGGSVYSVEGASFDVRKLEERSLFDD